MVNDKIDMVYLWCNGNDPAFKKRKNQFLNQNNNLCDEELSGDKRFFDNEELRYSLRSLEKNAPWINHIYIVSDRQIPKWLNTNYSKVSIIDHSQIMPKKLIPCFNSNVIEYFITNIPNLAEKFLYGNDDMFFGGELRPSDFFINNQPIVRVKLVNKYRTVKDAEYYFKQYFPSDKAVLNAYELLIKKFNKNKNENFYIYHHNIDAYTKSCCNLLKNEFKTDLEKTYSNRFRADNDISRIIFNMGSVYKNLAKLKIVTDPKPWRRSLHKIFPVNWESYLDNDSSKKLEKELLKFNPKFFCINSGSDCSYEQKSKIKNLLETLFPVPSKFEI